MVIIQWGGRNGVDQLNHGVIAKIDSRCRKHLGVEGVELIRILIGPEGEPLNSPDHLERPLESIDHVLTAEAIMLSGCLQGGGPRLHNVEGIVVHGVAVYAHGGLMTISLTWCPRTERCISNTDKLDSIKKSCVG